MKVVNRNKIIQVEVKGYKVYCESDTHELYDFFLATDKYQMPKKDAIQHVPEGHTVLHVKRDNQMYEVKFNNVLENQIKQ